MIRLAVQVGTALDTQTETLLATQWLERQVEHDVVPKQRLKVEEVALEPTGLFLRGLAARVDVELLDIDLLLRSDPAQAPYALTSQRYGRRSGDQHALDHRLEPKVKPNR
jgi:hypothetical protein